MVDIVGFVDDLKIVDLLIKFLVEFVEVEVRPQPLA